MLLEHKLIVRHLVDDVWSGGKLSLIDELVTPDFTYRCPLHPDSIVGRKVFKQWVAQFRGAFTGFRMTPTAYLIADGEQVMSRWKFSGVHSGTLLNIPPTFRAVEIEGVTVYRFEEAGAVEGWASYDRLLLMQQLGVVPELEMIVA